MTAKIVLVKRGSTIDLEFMQFKLEAGKTYYDDGTTIFDAYVVGGIADGSLVETTMRPDTITVTARERLPELFPPCRRKQRR